MPTFRTSPTAGLAASIRTLIGGAGGLNPLLAMQADHMAAQTAHSMSLAEKARQEAEGMRLAESRRADPSLREEYAAHAAGIDLPQASRLAGAIRGAIEQPGPADVADAALVGADAQPFQMAKPNLQPGQERVFRSALASTIGNLIATGKTNAEQMAHATDRTNETALVSDAANAPDVQTGNRIIAAVTGKLREPFKTNPQGTVLNEETGALDETGRLADEVRKKITAEAGLETARTATEGSKQGELRTRSTRNTSQAGLADARARNVGVTTVKPPSAAQLEKWVNETAAREWKVYDDKQRRGMNYQQHVEKIRERFMRTSPGGVAPKDEIADAHDAIRRGKDPAKVAKRFKERMGFDLPTPSAAASGANDDSED